MWCCLLFKSLLFCDGGMGKKYAVYPGISNFLKKTKSLTKSKIAFSYSIIIR